MKKTKRVISTLLAAVMLVMALPVNAFAAEDTAGNTETLTVETSVQYGQTEARTMLDYINAFRTGSGKGNHEEHPHQALDDKGNWKDYPDLQPLTYDYELEKVAMQRAAEIAQSFSHTRPDGTDWITAYPKIFKTKYGENIAVGQRDAWEAFLAWREDKDPYAMQGHRRNMLSSDFKVIGVGHAEVKGTHFWVQEFSKTASGAAQTTANDAKTNASIDVSGAQLAKNAPVTAAPEKDQLNVTMGTAADAPHVQVTFQMANVWPQNETRTGTISLSWASQDESIAVFADGKITGKKPGTVEFTASVWGTPVKFTANVTCEHKADEAWQSDEQNHWHQCALCGEKMELAAHTFGEWTVVKEATETATGLEERLCTACSYKQQQEIPMKEHQHQFGEWTLTTAPSCGKEGVETRTCVTCGAAENRPVAALEHQYEEVITTPPTCTADGVKTITCKNCGDSKTEAIPATGHAFGEWTLTTAPSCGKEGVETSTCAVCGAAETRPVAALEHQYEEVVTTPPTCTADGVKTITCKNCGDTKTEAIPATGHAFGEWTLTTAPSCGKEGVETSTCVTCGATETRPVAALAHQLTAHPEKAATCTEAGSPAYWSCSACGKNFADEKATAELTNEQLVIPALGHKMTHHEAVAAQCEKDGMAEYWSCERCGKNFADAEGKTPAGDLVLKATGHKFGEWAVTTAPSCGKEGVETRTCTACGKTETRPVAAFEHQYEEKVTKQPTCTEEGAKTLTCKLCGEQKTEAIAALGHQMKHVDRVDPTDAKPGNLEYWHCERCGKNFADEKGTKELANVTLTMVPAETQKAAAVVHPLPAGAAQSEADKEAAQKLLASVKPQNILEKGDVLKKLAEERTAKSRLADQDARALLQKNNIPVNDQQKMRTVAQYYLEVTLQKLSVQGLNKSITWNVTPRYQLMLTTAKPGSPMVLEGAGRNTVRIADEPLVTGEKVSFELPLPEKFADKGADLQISHRAADGKIYIYTGKADVRDGSLCLPFTSEHGFNEFTISASEATAVVTANNAKTYYSSLQDAVADAPNGSVIELERSCNEKVVVNRAVSFTFKDPEKLFSGSIVAGTGYELKKDGEVYTVTAAAKPVPPEPPKPTEKPDKPEEPAKPTPTPKPAFDWESVRAALAGMKSGKYQKDVGREVAVPHYVWQAFYGKDVTVTFVRGTDKFVFNGLDLARTGFDPDNGHNLTDLTAYIGRTYTKPVPTTKPEKEPVETEEPEPTATPTPAPTASPAPTATPEPAEPTPAPDADSEAQQTSGEASGFAWWIWLLIAVAVVLIGFIVVLLVKRRGEDEEQ